MPCATRSQGPASFWHMRCAFAQPRFLILYGDDWQQSSGSLLKSWQREPWAAQRTADILLAMFRNSTFMPCLRTRNRLWWITLKRRVNSSSQGASSMRSFRCKEYRFKNPYAAEHQCRIHHTRRVGPRFSIAALADTAAARFDAASRSHPC
jgi:hypothetical protein